MDYFDPKALLFCRMKRREEALKRHLKGMKCGPEYFRLLSVIGNLARKSWKLFRELEISY